MLAYIFWHRPQQGVESAAYEEAQRAFHRSLAIDSACFRLGSLPFGAGGGYEDWYLVEGWSGLGALNERAVDGRRRPSHDEAASLSAEGWGGVYALVRGAPRLPAGAGWLERPRGEDPAGFIASLDADAVWQRQLVLGPAPELCVVSTSPTPGRVGIWPRDGDR
jgi:hypothetical protein